MPGMFREDYLNLLKLVKGKSCKPNLKLVKKAFYFSTDCHKGQKRLSGEAFFAHPLKAALMLADLGMDSESIAAALLHDCLEDTGVSAEKIRKEFGKGVLELVSGVSKLKKILSKNRKEQRAQNLERLLLAGTKDLRVLIIKLADKVHNLETIKYHSRENQRRICSEALKVYAPLAHKLSMHKTRYLIEDLAFKALHPEKFEQLRKIAFPRKKMLEKAILEVIAKLKQECSMSGIPVVFSREEKSIYNVYEKTERFGKSINEVNDFEILEIITNNVDDCYLILGKLHSLFKPIPRKFKDLIALPEYNLYQALQSTIIGPHGIPVKCYINTFEMHEIGDFGITYFFRHKSPKNLKLLKEKMHWLHSLVRPETLKGTDDFLKSLNSGLSEEIIVFTPKGEKISLPLGSNSIDFAFKIHTDLGHHCWKSIVNGKEVPITKALNVGNIVRIIASEKPQSRRKWLSIVRSHSAIESLKSKFKNP